jgi:UDP-N-acetylmuramoylalanine--D-glutamate ligase
MHNVENYMSAICAVWGIVDKDTIVKVAKTFKGVEHRAEFVRELDGVKYYNDSIASSPTRTASGTLSLYDEKIIIIAGGYDKNLDYDELGEMICKKVKILILMGNTADKIEASTKKATSYSNGNPKIIRVSNMEEAVAKARENAVAGDRVSLSPASASFDLYKNFMERGIHFKNIVNSLK